MKRLATLLLLCCLSLPAHAAGSAIEPRVGWAVHNTFYSYTDLLARTKAAIKSQDMFLVTEAGPTEAAKGRGITIPGNRVLGVFRNDFAVRAIRLSVPAMIEAPVRLYVTENPDGTATLSYKTPSFVFQPYLAEGGEEMASLARELDAIFAAIALEAAKKPNRLN